jgi:hypothetical protein
VLEHPAYSLDLAPSDFLLFPKIKEKLKGRQFDDIDDIRSNTSLNRQFDVSITVTNIFRTIVLPVTHP